MILLDQNPYGLHNNFTRSLDDNTVMTKYTDYAAQIRRHSIKIKYERSIYKMLFEVAIYFLFHFQGGTDSNKMESYNKKVAQFRIKFNI